VGGHNSVHNRKVVPGINKFASSSDRALRQRHDPKSSFLSLDTIDILG
jgi:hypothetical protein